MNETLSITDNDSENPTGQEASELGTRLLESCKYPEGTSPMNAVRIYGERFAEIEASWGWPAIGSWQ